jgi:uncharacterized protein GlcG (DUF336 family)
MHMARRLTVILFVLGCRLSVLAQPAAQPDDAKRAEASAHFRRAVELFQEEAFRAALVEFQRAYEIAPDYRLHYNIGQTKLRLQDYLGVVHSYEKYLGVGGGAIPPERRAQVEEDLVALRDRVGRVAITCNRNGAEVFIDDVSAGRTPLPVTVAVNVGRHRVLVRASDGASESKLVDVAGGDIAEVAFDLRPARPLASHAAPSPVSWSPMKHAAVWSWSGGGAILAGAAVTGALTFGAQNELDDAIATEGVSSETIEDESKRLDKLALTTDILIATGAAAVVIGTVLWFVDHKVQRKDKGSTAGGRSGAASLRSAFGRRGALLNVSF